MSVNFNLTLVTHLSDTHIIIYVIHICILLMNMHQWVENVSALTVAMATPPLTLIIPESVTFMQFSSNMAKHIASRGLPPGQHWVTTRNRSTLSGQECISYREWSFSLSDLPQAHQRSINSVSVVCSPGGIFSGSQMSPFYTKNLFMAWLWLELNMSVQKLPKFCTANGKYACRISNMDLDCHTTRRSCHAHNLHHNHKSLYKSTQELQITVAKPSWYVKHMQPKWLADDYTLMATGWRTDCHWSLGSPNNKGVQSFDWLIE